MPTLRREDGAQFVVQSYRELLSSKKISALKREIRSLAKNHGEFIRCFRQLSGQMEVAFSREPGFLLGEAVWNYFNRPSDLIYCEALPDKQHALLVIIKSGSVYLDTKAVFTDLIDEFVALAMNLDRYQIFVYGDVPLSDTKSEGVFVFDKSRVLQFTKLDEPVFPKLELNINYQLQPLELALTSAEFSRKLFLPSAAIVIAILAGIFIWHFYQSTVKMAQIEEEIAKTPYEAYVEAMSSPAPKEQMHELINLIGKFLTFPGWQVAEINYKERQYNIKLKAVTGVVTDQLQNWAKLNHISVQTNADGATVVVASMLKNRIRPLFIYNLNKTLAKFIGRLATVVDRGDIAVGGTTVEGGIKSASVTINFHDLSPGILSLISRIMEGFPIELSTISINVKDNLLSGNIQLAIWGN